MHSRQVVSCPVQPRACHWSCGFLARFQWREAYVLDNWQLAELPQSGGREFDPRQVHDNLSVPLWVYMRFPVPEHQHKTKKYVYRQRQGAVQNKHTQVLKLTPVHARRVVSCPVQPRACHWSCVFWRDFSCVKHTCWTTGSWRSCPSLEVVSSIPDGSTIIYRFLCGLICVFLCQNIKIKPRNMNITSARAQFKINTHRC